MFEKLETYLEEIGHFLSGREEREEILSEIRSHILEKTEREFGRVTDEALAKVIAGFGPPRRVAARYVAEEPIIAPVYQRFLFRYTALLFGIHFLFILAAVIFHDSFIMFPILFVPRMGPFEALFYLPTAFLFDLGAVTLVLYLITRSGKEVALPWPKFSVDLDEVKTPRRRVRAIVGAGFMTALTGFAVYVFIACRTIFVLNLDFSAPRPLFDPAVGYRISLIVIGMLAAGAIAAIVKIFTASRWVDLASNAVSLALIGLLLRQPFDDPFAVASLARLAGPIRKAGGILPALRRPHVAIEMVKDLVVIGRGKLKGGRNRSPDPFRSRAGASPASSRRSARWRSGASSGGWPARWRGGTARAAPCPSSRPRGGASRRPSG